MNVQGGRDNRLGKSHGNLGVRKVKTNVVFGRGEGEPKTHNNRLLRAKYRLEGEEGGKLGVLGGG